MDEGRLERLEARLAAVEGEIHRLRAASAPPPVADVRPATPPPVAAVPPPVSPPAAVPGFVVADAAVPGLAPYAPPAPPRSAAAAAPSSSSLEGLIAGRGLQIAGAILVLFGAAFFLDLAFTRGWIGPAERILLGLVTGATLILVATRQVAPAYRTLAESLIGLGAGILYLSLWASVASFPELHVPRGAVFIAMIAVTAVLCALAAVRRSQRIALMGAFGGFITPVLLAGGPNDRGALAAYVLMLTVALLSVAARYEFGWVEGVTLVGVLAYAADFAPAPDEGWTATAAQIVATLLFLAFAVAFSSAPAGGGAERRKSALLTVSTVSYCLVLELLFSDRRTILGADFLVLAAALLLAVRVRASAPVLARTYGYLSLGALTLALIAFLHGATLTDALSIESGLLFVVGRRTGDVWIARTGAVMLVVTGFIVFSLGFADPQSQALGVALRFAIWLASAGYALFTTRDAATDPAMQPLRAMCRIGFDVVAVAAISRACLDLTAGPNWSADNVPSAAQFAVSLVWTAYATGLFGYGLRRRIGLLRWEGLALFGITILKVFSVDLSSVDIEWRVMSFVVLGAVLFAVSAWYTRSMNAEAPSNE